MPSRQAGGAGTPADACVNRSASTAPGTPALPCSLRCACCCSAARLPVATDSWGASTRCGRRAQQRLPAWLRPAGRPFGFAPLQTEESDGAAGGPAGDEPAGAQRPRGGST